MIIRYYIIICSRKDTCLYSVYNTLFNKSCAPCGARELKRITLIAVLISCAPYGVRELKLIIFNYYFFSA